MYKPSVVVATPRPPPRRQRRPSTRRPCSGPTAARRKARGGVEEATGWAGVATFANTTATAVARGGGRCWRAPGAARRHRPPLASAVHRDDTAALIFDTCVVTVATFSKHPPPLAQRGSQPPSGCQANLIGGGSRRTLAHAPRAQAAGAAATTPESPRPTAALGTTVAGGRLRRPVGSGAMGCCSPEQSTMLKRKGTNIECYQKPNAIGCDKGVATGRARGGTWGRGEEGDGGGKEATRTCVVL